MKLTNEQEQASKHGKGPALVLAVPGSGKTTMLLRRTKLLIESGVDPKRILIITFSKMAAKDMEMRFLKNLYKGGPKPYFSTIHSFCYSIIRSFERKSGLEYRLLESNNGLNKYKLLKDLFFDFNSYYPNEDQLDNLIREISYVKNKMVDPTAFSKNTACKTPKFKDIFDKYESVKKANLFIDFDDMINLSMEILKNNQTILNGVRKAYDYVMVDEGQDTSYGQMQVIQSIVKPKNNLFIVADDDQSIYGFRGADYKGLFNLSKTYPNLMEYYLSVNFRSTHSIVNTCRMFIEQNKDRFEKKLSTFHEKGNPPKVLRLKDLKAQYEYIIKELQEKDLGQVAILYRNNICALGLVEALESHNISFRSNDTKNYIMSHWVLRDLFDIIEFSKDTSRIDLYERFYYKINGYVSKNNVDYVKKRQNGQSVFDILSKAQIPNYLQKNLRDLKSDFQHLKSLPLKDAFRFIEFDLNYRTYITKHAKTFGSSEQSSLRILFYLKYIAKKEKDLDLFIGRLKHLDYLLKGGRVNDSSLVLSTLHGAKGLEFDSVFIIDLIDGIIPSPSSPKNSDLENRLELEEERRLFYVGMSRAKKNLYLLSPKTINHFATKESEFLEQVRKIIK